MNKSHHYVLYQYNSNNEKQLMAVTADYELAREWERRNKRNRGFHKLPFIFTEKGLDDVKPVSQIVPST